MENATDLEDIAPYVAEIVDDFCKMAEPDSKFHDKSELISASAELFRSKLTSCCAYHRMSEIAHIQVGLRRAIKNCTCDDTLQHEAITAMVESIQKHMSECVNAAIIKQLLFDSRN